MNIKDKILKGRFIVSVIYLLVFLVFFLFSFLLKDSNGVGAIITRVIMMVITFSVVAWMTYELLKAFDIHYIVAIILALATLASLLAHFDNFRTIFDQNPYETESVTGSVITMQMVVSTLKDILKNWRIYLIFLIEVTVVFAFYLVQVKRKVILSRPNVIASNMLLIAVSLFLLIIFFNGLLNIFILFPEFALIIVFVPVITDTSAFLGGILLGRKFIRRKFAPFVSPKKTWEGTLIGFLAGAILVQIIYWSFNIQGKFFFVTNPDSASVASFAIYLTVILPIFSIVGDLYFSYIKRVNQLKDYSKILGNHGGLLDRFDSIIFVNFFALLAISFY
ncbi:phosphatidate cytidylyltransferase [Mycoplasmopsis agassizii]|uniref:Phosphatidate cytidylyltransferase n=1 Tax=Mycoplasmopsis agassizii TaxID=33922 RepID=A0ABX4H639_9BACT|nr:phosphatidate cytidylyltransferase [Mycoplasmopsis agassizii]PAF55346.1 phosphatidate cytidylyltransferase [Mycoplasmopsis agassizii]SMC15809.1 phosphatidate cytidylyltransferase [Mycoplasmopsis agassizii]